MAGDWIKMRGNLWDDPRVTRLVDLTDSSEAAVVGGLYWLWATADQHSEDGFMPGLSVRGIDRKTGVPGLGAALVEIAWIADHPEGIRILRFEDHNGASAKARLMTAKRVAEHKANAKVTVPPLPEPPQSVTSPLPREREDLEEEVDQNQKQPQRAAEAASENANPAARCSVGELAIAARKTGVQCQSANPVLMEIAEQGVTVATLTAACIEAVDSNPGQSVGIKYVASILRRWAKERASVDVAGALPPQARASPGRQPKFDPVAHVNQPKAQAHERTIELDAAGEPL